MKLAVIGHPIIHSKSPLIHNRWLAEGGLEGTYEAIDIAPDDLENQIKNIINQKLTGFNVTIPHKQSILKYCRKLEATAAAIGAVNTVKIEEGVLHGYNTDAYGFIQNIRQNAPDFDFKDKVVCVLGAGGAANAVLYGLLESGVQKIYLTNRTIEKAKTLSEFDSEKIEVVLWKEKEKFLYKTDLLVNTTSLGMTNHKELEIDLEPLKENAIVTDIVYAPLKTNLLKQAEVRGHQTVTGIGMLLYQAQKSFEIWTGNLPNVDEAVIEEVLK